MLHWLIITVISLRYCTQQWYYITFPFILTWDFLLHSFRTISCSVSGAASWNLVSDFHLCFLLSLFADLDDIYIQCKLTGVNKSFFVVTGQFVRFSISKLISSFSIWLDMVSIISSKVFLIWNSKIKLQTSNLEYNTDMAYISILF